MSFIDEAYNVLTKDEESKSLGRMQAECAKGWVSFTMQYVLKPKMNFDTQGNTVVCTSCGKNAHFVENCF